MYVCVQTKARGEETEEGDEDVEVGTLQEGSPKWRQRQRGK